MKMSKKICVYCGSSMGYDRIYQQKAEALGNALYESGCELLYGGGSVGLMKIIADTMLKRGGKVIGVIPTYLVDMEVGYKGITELIEVETMADRKTKLEEMADAFIAMPGGFGTMDEFFEVLVLGQLRIIDKPIALYNINGYYDSLLQFADHAVKEGFVRQEHRDNIIVTDDPATLIDKLQTYHPVEVGKWIEGIHAESANVSKMMIIGITGTLGAGKGTIVDYLVKEKGFVHYSVRAFITEEIERRGLEVNRDTLTEVANDLRAKHCPSYITDQLYLRASENGRNAIIESVRTPGEITSLRSKGEFYLLAVDADQKIRYERISKRGSETDSVDFETFVMNEKREMNSSDPNKQNLSSCISQADFVLNNNGTIEDLYHQVENILGQIENR